jgi:hypothetical protein
MNASKPQDDFSLKKIETILADYSPTISDFHPSGFWKNEYDWYGIPAGKPWLFGSMCLRRESGSGDISSLTVDCRRLGKSGFHFFVHAEFVCLNDALSTPSSWVSTSKMAREAGDEPYLNSGLSKEGVVEGNTLRITAGDHLTEAEIPGAYTSKWCLMDAIQRLAGSETDPIAFSLIDEVDQVRHNQTVAFRKQASVLIGDQNCELDSYSHTGEGVIPTVFWVDKSGRLLFVISGIEILVLKKSVASG